MPFYETDVGKSSVKALLTAGAPSSTGHDEERMLRTLREIMEQDGLVPMRIGVNTGKVFTGDFGPPYRRAYRVFGDAINTAARVMSKADAGQILSTEIVLNRSRTIFDVTPIAPFAAKGKSEPVKASIVGPAIGVKESHHGGVDLLGRERETAALLAAVERARAGRASIVEISGEPGMGKTRLVEDVCERSKDFRVVHSRCEEYESATPYFAFRSIVRSALQLEDDADTDVVVARLGEAIRDVDPSLEPWTPLLGILLGLDLPDTPETAALGERFIRDRLSEVGIHFLGAVLSGAPSIFVIEDIHHLDEASHDLLLRLSRAAADRRQVLIVTRQGTGDPFATDAPDMPELIAIELEPLGRDALVEIIDSATEDDPLPRHEVDEIARRSGGNALFLFELLEAVRETGSIDSLPDSIEAMIAGEIDRLPPSDRTILRYAAVLGASFDSDMLAHAVADDVDLDDGGLVAPGRTPEPRSLRVPPLPQHPHPRRGLRGAAVPAAASAAWSDRRDHRGAGRYLARRRGRDARIALLRGAAVGQGLGVLPAGRRSRARHLRQRRGRPSVRGSPRGRPTPSKRHPHRTGRHPRTDRRRSPQPEPA